MLSKEQIEKNKKKFLETSQKYNVFTKELEEFLGEDFFIAPASPSLDMYSCYPGGLVEHLLKVCKYSIQINDLLPEGMRVEKNSVIRTSILAQIGKTYLFKFNESEWHRKTLGKIYEYQNGDINSMTVGERSAYYATTHNVKLSEDEYQAIIQSDKECSEKFIRWNCKPLTQIIKLGFELAVLEEKNGKK